MPCSRILTASSKVLSHSLQTFPENIENIEIKKYRYKYLLTD